jgi:hypothetical protein
MSTWREQVAEGRRLAEDLGTTQWALGDLVQEVDPDRLQKFADEIGVGLDSLQDYRRTAASWPADTRRAGVSFTVHRVLSGHPERFTLIRSRKKWTKRDAQEATGNRRSAGEKPTPAQIVEAVRENPDAARALARHDDTREAIEEHAITARAEKGRVLRTEAEEAHKAIRDASARAARSWQDDLALGELRQAIDCVGSAIVLKEEYGVTHPEKEQELMEQLRRLTAAYESGHLTTADQAWLDSLGVQS